MRIDALASMPHYLDHILPVWGALDPDERGTLYLRGHACGVTDLPHRVGAPRRGQTAILVASYMDLRLVGTRPVVFAEHGAGQRYGEAEASYAGGRGRGSVVLFLCPNAAVADANRAAYPDARCEVIGSPRLDVYHRSPQALRRGPVAFSFHWPCKLVPESDWAFPHYRSALAGLALERALLGHGHPRAWRKLEPFWRGIGVKAEPSFDAVCARAGMLAVDNSSAGPEFAAATDRPILWLDAPWYRRDVSWGGRFWDWAELAPWASGTADLADRISEALEDAEPWPALRRELVRLVYADTLDGGASKRGAEAIRNLLAR